MLLQMSKLIMSHMSKEPFSLSMWPLFCLAATLVNSRLQLVPGFSLACAVNFFALAAYLHYVCSVVLEICAYLNIHCFTIPVPQEDKTR